MEYPTGIAKILKMTLPPITNCPLPLVQDVMSTSCSQDQMKKKNKIKQLNSNYMNSATP